jgi:hypothetical protein
VIIHDLDVLSSRLLPAKAEPELIVDSDAVLAGAIALQGLQSISRRNAQIVEPLRNLKLTNLSPSNGCDPSKPRDALATGKSRRIAAPKRLNHASQ